MEAAGIQYREYSPCPALRPYVQCYWAGSTDAMSSGPDRVHRVVPDGCIDILVEFSYRTADTGQPTVPRFGDRTSIVGTMSRPLIVTAPDPTCFIGVRFKPGKATGFLGVSAGELTDQSIALSEVWRRDVYRLEDGLTDRHTIGQKLAFLEAALLERLKLKKDDDPYVEPLVGLILQRRGAVAIEALSEFAGISRQHVARKFDRYVGITPKLFCRVVRFQDLMKTIRLTDKVDWATTALDFGYYDQAHMISEFKKFSGLTPASFAANA
jgi:AraC-like DNA-binding protein